MHININSSLDMHWLTFKTTTINHREARPIDYCACKIESSKMIFPANKPQDSDSFKSDTWEVETRLRPVIGLISWKSIEFLVKLSTSRADLSRAKANFNNIIPLSDVSVATRIVFTRTNRREEGKNCIETVSN